MKTTTGSTPRPGLHVGLTLTVSASVALEGTALWLALSPRSHASAAALAALTGGGLACLIGAALTAASVRRERRDMVGGAGQSIGVPRTAEEAAALAHAQKMQALGLLAGGLAHDFNNLLHVIRNSLEILQRQEAGADTGRYLEMIRRSAERATTLTGQLLAFSRRQPLQLRPIDPNDLVAQVSELLRYALGDRIDIETVLERGVPTVAVDAGQLETALLNLAINARDATPQAGLLTIETANAMLDATAYVMIAVSDTGTGMPPEVAGRACEPFFTTKEPGQGTGLGLSQVARFAQQSGGHVRISSEPGKGTTVRLYLPSSGCPERKPAAPWPARRLTEAAGGAALAVGAGPGKIMDCREQSMKIG